MLALPDFIKPFIMELDVLNKGMGVIVVQKNRPLAYLNKALNKK